MIENGMEELGGLFLSHFGMAARLNHALPEAVDLDGRRLAERDLRPLRIHYPGAVAVQNSLGAPVLLDALGVEAIDPGALLDRIRRALHLGPGFGRLGRIEPGPTEEIEVEEECWRTEDVRQAL